MRHGPSYTTIVPSRGCDAVSAGKTQPPSALNARREKRSRQCSGAAAPMPDRTGRAEAAVAGSVSSLGHPPLWRAVAVERAVTFLAGRFPAGRRAGAGPRGFARSARVGARTVGAGECRVAVAFERSCSRGSRLADVAGALVGSLVVVGCFALAGSLTVAGCLALAGSLDVAGSFGEGAIGPLRPTRPGGR